MQSVALRSGSDSGGAVGIGRQLAAGDCDALLVFAGLAVPAMLFFAFIGNLPLGLAFTVVAVAVTPRFRIIAAAAAPGTHATLACAVAAILLTTLGGEGRLVAANVDWRIRDAVLHDLVAQPWPFIYRFDGHDWLLRAPLGMYLLPALAGKLVGQYGATLVLWLQNSVAIFIVLRILSAAQSRAHSLTVAIVFVIFSGWDVPAALVTHRGGTIPADIGWWAGLFQYSSTITLAYWVPNHAIAGWFMAVLLLLWDQQRIHIGALAIGAGLAMFWSPFAMVGALPFLMKAGIDALRARSVGRSDLVATVAIATALLPVALYLGADSLQLPHGFQRLSIDFLTSYGVFVGFEVVPLIVFNFYAGGSGGFSRTTYRTAIVVLLLLPFYHMGPANDLVMRASIPALAIVAVTTGHSMYAVIARRRLGPIVIAAGALAMGALTGFAQTANVVRTINLGTSRCDVIEAWQQHSGSWVEKTVYFARLEHLPTILRAPAPSVHSTGATTRLCSDWRL